MTPTERQRLIDRLDEDLCVMMDWPLSKFSFSDDVARLTPGLLKYAPMSKKELAEHERKVGAMLIEMIEDGDYEGLRKVARVVRHWVDPVEHPKETENFWDWKLAVQFLRDHVDAPLMTLNEIQQRAGLSVTTKTIQRWCEGYGFPFIKGKGGRPKGS